MADPHDRDVAIIQPPDPDPPDPGSNPSNQNQNQTQSVTINAPASTSGQGATHEPLSPSPNSSSSTPNWLRWSKGLNALLDDPQGQDLFKTYLEQEGCYLQLTFLWACEGLKCTAINDPPKIPDLVRKIYHFFIPNLIGLNDETRSELAQNIVDGRFTEIQIFNKSEEEVLTHMKDNLYPNFLKSELYLSAANGEDQHSSSSASNSARERRQSEGDESVVSTTEDEPSSSMRVGVGGGSTHSPSKLGAISSIDPITGEIIPEQLSPKVPSPPLSSYASVQQALLPNQLQTVHEDTELNMNSSSQQVMSHSSSMKLTKDALRATERVRASDFSKSRKTETAPSHYLASLKHIAAATPAPVHPYHASYSSYNPVSRMDSEIQSMSSDAMTDEGVHSHHGRKHGSRQHRHHSHSSGNVSMHQHSSDDQGRLKISGIPSGARLDNTDNLPVFTVPPARGNVLDKKMNTDAEKDPPKFAAVLMKKLEDVKRSRESDQRIQKKLIDPLEHHNPPSKGGNILAAAINKLQHHDDELPSDILDKHVSMIWPQDVTPTTRSPKLRSPTIGRRRGGLPAVPPTFPVNRRRDRVPDATSLFSVDSGNIRDYSSELSLLSGGMTKSRSVPYELTVRQPDHDMSSTGPWSSRGHHQLRGDPNRALRMMKKSSMEYLDSGVSVVSGPSITPLPRGFPHPQLPRPSLPQTQMDPGFQQSESRVREWMEQCGDSSKIRPGKSTNSPPSQRRKKITVPNTQPTGPPPATASTLEEVRKRLAKNVPSIPESVGSYSTQSTVIANPLAGFSTVLPRHSPPSAAEDGSKESIPAFVIYDDSDVPFVVKIQKNRDRDTTLAVFKDHLPKRGFYRYFFKTECPELDSKIVWEEITDDSNELPMHEGRIFAHLKVIPTGTGTSATPSQNIVSDKVTYFPN